MMKHEKYNLKLLNLDNLTDHPFCLHGPTFLFETTTKSKNKKRFYACAGCRDRKDCNFYLEDNYGKDYIIKYKEKKLKIFQDELSKINKIFTTKRLAQFLEFQTSQRRFCQTCGLLLLTEEHSDHCHHKIQENINNEHLHNPSKLILPLSNNKKEAQFFFAKSCVKFIVNLVRDLNYKKIISIGTPTIHEYIQNEIKSCDSILLDIDHRYKQFYQTNKFLHYNLFNNYFFDGDSAIDVFKKFISNSISSDEIIIIIDPPFGGLIEAIANTVEKLNKLIQTENGWNNEKLISLIIFFPYFNEFRLISDLPVSMCDYVVHYENHNKFKYEQKNNKSPVRFFTNIQLSKIILPEDQGYHYCNKCQKYVSKLNKHCDICNSCTSKDGKIYNHCKICNKCVKSLWVHCKKCNKCALPQCCSCKRKSNEECSKTKHLNKKNKLS